ncbi:triose-phosphate isomerase [Thermoanaerobacterium thermosaccharolyticum]|uniref:Triosephosphate isomerase n=1 Tax=Thermoanaerobacterium thermosaccharolyticum TaxID=1517 RepID=A0A231VL25_THETR|nr:triose-phosphate isomerase [Thermoanaerobacterium thermosaccharolyticum]AST56638.1 triosephosphate isomerase [Thermoanaerobacterium thermosaccharolyticum]MBE0067497.1 triose-phosphate isomerase [Thermoanaerobacterium thermosaccharolyticum]MBE0227040.1 triose-phosphate isomerase [Thermoanaerobacterium thermosaccharolyticum]MCP2239944.1 triosephosphate isomerase [Thermoanaerobacterium thermosaccharolyticum]OXT08366.1 triose-phosphate isomerase [Thermoanaerobacterium thermosaccharolyticum]
MRIPIIAGNWKMHMTPSDAVNLVNELKPLVADTDVEVVVIPPFVDLVDVKKALDGSNIRLGAQNMHWEEKGAFTGEVSPLMLKEIGVEYVVIGHSERRQYFAETDETVNRKVKSALSHGLKPIVCVGETLSQREDGKAFDVVREQTKKALDDVLKNDVTNVVIAYEPIWAIGTGKTATSKDANDVIKVIRETIASVYDINTANEVRIQYGGSVKPDNAKELMSESDIDGALVGGASLKAQDFAKIVNY